jgi:hypothetical protein
MGFLGIIRSWICRAALLRRQFIIGYPESRGDKEWSINFSYLRR